MMKTLIIEAFALYPAIGGDPTLVGGSQAYRILPYVSEVEVQKLPDQNILQIVDIEAVALDNDGIVMDKSARFNDLGLNHTFHFGNHSTIKRSEMIREGLDQIQTDFPVD